MDFRYVVYTEGRVEDWMNLVLNEMRSTNKFITKKAIFYYGKNWRIPRYNNYKLIELTVLVFEVKFYLSRYLFIHLFINISYIFRYSVKYEVIVFILKNFVPNDG